jgi:hypothetical protein
MPWCGSRYGDDALVGAATGAMPLAGAASATIFGTRLPMTHCRHRRIVVARMRFSCRHPRESGDPGSRTSRADRSVAWAPAFAGATGWRRYRGSVQSSSPRKRGPRLANFQSGSIRSLDPGLRRGDGLVAIPQIGAIVIPAKAGTQARELPERIDRSLGPGLRRGDGLEATPRIRAIVIPAKAGTQARELPERIDSWPGPRPSPGRRVGGDIADWCDRHPRESGDPGSRTSRADRSVAWAPAFAGATGWLCCVESRSATCVASLKSIAAIAASTKRKAAAASTMAPPL